MTTSLLRDVSGEIFWDLQSRLILTEISPFLIPPRDRLSSVKLVPTGSDNDVSPLQCQAITNTDLLSIGP